MQAQNIRTALRGKPKITASTTYETFRAACPELAAFDKGAVTVGRFATQGPWEFHPDGDELLHVLDGQIEVILLTDDEPVHVFVRLARSSSFLRASGTVRSPVRSRRFSPPFLLNMGRPRGQKILGERQARRQRRLVPSCCGPTRRWSGARGRRGIDLPESRRATFQIGGR